MEEEEKQPSARERFRQEVERHSGKIQVRTCVASPMMLHHQRQRSYSVNALISPTQRTAAQAKWAYLLGAMKTNPLFLKGLSRRSLECDNDERQVRSCLRDVIDMVEVQAETCQQIWLGSSSESSDPPSPSRSETPTPEKFAYRSKADTMQDLMESSKTLLTTPGTIAEDQISRQDSDCFRGCAFKEIIISFALCDGKTYIRSITCMKSSLEQESVSHTTTFQSRMRVPATATIRMIELNVEGDTMVGAVLHMSHLDSKWVFHAGDCSEVTRSCVLEYYPYIFVDRDGSVSRGEGPEDVITEEHILDHKSEVPILSDRGSDCYKSQDSVARYARETTNFLWTVRATTIPTRSTVMLIYIMVGAGILVKSRRDIITIR